MTPPLIHQGGQPGSTSSAWLLRLQTRDADAWRRLMHDYGPLVYTWCRRQGLPAQETPDVIQEVFRAVAAHLDAFQHQGTGSFRGWLRTITRNKVHDHFRARQAGQQGAGGSEAQQQFLEVPEASSVEMETGEHALLVRAVLERIRPEFAAHTWQAFWRMTVDGHNSGDIARDLGMNVAAVRQSKARVLRRLREELEGEK